MVAQMEVAGDVPTSVVGAAEVQDESLSTAGTHGIDENKMKMLWELASKGHGLTEDEKESLYSLLLEYEDVFASGPEDVGQTGKTTHTIDTGNSESHHDQGIQVWIYVELSPTCNTMEQP